jgi:hypothetical protein
VNYLQVFRIRALTPEEMRRVSTGCRMMQAAAATLFLQEAGNRRVRENSSDSLLTLQSVREQYVSVHVRGGRGSATEICTYGANIDK